MNDYLSADKVSTNSVQSMLQRFFRVNRLEPELLAVMHRSTLFTMDFSNTGFILFNSVFLVDKQISDDAISDMINIMNRQSGLSRICRFEDEIEADYALITSGGLDYASLKLTTDLFALSLEAAFIGHEDKISRIIVDSQSVSMTTRLATLNSVVNMFD